MTRPGRIGFIGVLLATVALFGQIALAPLLQREAANAVFASGLLDGSAICHGDANAPDRPGHQHGGIDCILCPCCAAPVTTTMLPPPPPPAPMPSIARDVAMFAPPPPARGPPGRVAQAAQPRGPPAAA